MIESILFLLFIIPMAILAILFCCRASGETGLNPITPLGIVTFIVVGFITRKFEIVIFSGAFVCATGLAASSMINTFKSGEILGTPKKKLLNAQIVGGIFGALIGSVALAVISKMYAIGSENFPSPVSYAWGNMVLGIENGKAISSLNYPMSFCSIVIVFILNKIKLSSICFGIGIIIPPMYSSTLFLGGLYRKLIEKNKKNNITYNQFAMSGLIIGEGIVMLIAIILKLF